MYPTTTVPGPQSGSVTMSHTDSDEHIHPSPTDDALPASSIFSRPKSSAPEFSTKAWHGSVDEGIAPDCTPDGDIHPLTRSRTMTLLGGRLKFRPKDDDDASDWWFASTAIPLIVATFAPMANMLSIAALVVYWRNYTRTDDPATKYTTSYGRRDPQWCLNLNGASLACGFVGNAFLLCNFTQKIRYIIALPVTIVFFYVASSILTGIIIAMNVYVPPGPDEVYSQGFWYAVIAACLYQLCGMLLMVNMLGYFLGHYPQHFDLNDEQRNLILQTMIFFLWLSGGAGVFSVIEPDWDYPDALYFCDVTLLTIGFGDFYATNDVGRGLVFPFSVGGTIILGLMVSSIHKFAQELSKEKVVRKHIETRRVNTLSRAATLQDVSTEATTSLQRTPSRKNTPLSRVTSILLPSRTQKAILMYSERDRFNKMREIQFAAKRFKKWYALTMSVISFGLLWCVGAMVFYFVEQDTQGLTYFQSLYFCYVSLLTIGYGDLSPKSNAGKPFFVLWSLIAVPAMTILVSDLGDTAISGFKRKVLEYGGLAFLGKGRGWGLDWFTKEKVKMKRRLSAIAMTLESAPGRRSTDIASEEKRHSKTIDELVREDLSRPEMLKRLAYALRDVAIDLKDLNHKGYTYEEWVEFTRLIRFSKLDSAGRAEDGEQLEYNEAKDGIVEWDWLAHNSPMTSEQSEPEWVMERLLESLLRTFVRADIAEQLARLAQPAPPAAVPEKAICAEPEEYSDTASQRSGHETGSSAKYKHAHRHHIKAHTRPRGVTFHPRHDRHPRHEKHTRHSSGSNHESASIDEKS